ncbi:YeeE/YedE family protein [Roseibacterium beibuensis]|uniref:YeeE/YedE family protein n=1 Tax=[Roseibacterium] beibuensis TaxID=1193142 RepID=A0ABP9KT18_9RHOB|nr:YeeE/YedE family protein [Roseibacterium beibuensis]MCS6622251.1 YeeE/YedE family protein [Roseibacterium beibuensis]
MYETLALDLSPRAASLWLGLALGLAFGALAQLTRFCLRRAVAGPVEERASARGVWAMALAVSILGTQAAVALGWVSFDAHRFHVSALPVVGITVGGLLFGVGAVLARGCISRLTVLSGAGNLRALTALFVFAVFAHATLQGALSPVRTGLSAATVDLGAAVSLAALPGGAAVWAALLAVAALGVAWRSGAGLWMLSGAALLGALVPLGWVGTGFVLYDEFDPIALESLSFTKPWADSLFWGVAASLVEPGFGVGLIGGVLAGAIVAAIAARRFAWEAFTSPVQMGRTLSGAALMGVGGVLAGGCTVGAGLAGVPTLSVAAILALVSIVAGMWGAGVVEARIGSQQRANHGAVPAE